MQTYFETNSSSLWMADFDYFRLPQEKWVLMLTRLQQLGVNALYLALPWRFHEFEPGRIDLDGTTEARRDVRGLLAVCHRFGWPCLLDLGPYIDRGVLGDGWPGWLQKETADPDSVLRPAIKRWYNTAGRLLGPYQWPAGPIIALKIGPQLDETGPRLLSRQVTEVKWPIWLRKRYHPIEALNAAYGTAYRSASDVPFPETWAAGTTPLEQDAKIFLEEIEADLQSDYTDLLAEAGWRTPVYSPAAAPPAGLPPLQAHSLTDAAAFSAWVAGQRADSGPLILNLHHPIQVDPDWVELGRSPAWAETAPIRPDGSLRRKFWHIRRALWGQALPEVAGDERKLIIKSENNLFVSCAGDTPLKVETTLPSKTPVHRLSLAGRASVAGELKVSRKKLSGLYVTEEAAEQIDGLFLLAEASAPLQGFLADYLRRLLTGQASALAQGARLAEQLAASLELEANGPETPASTPPPARATTYILDEARRGLREADAALRKAMLSIGQLEGGLATITGQDEPPAAKPAAAPVAIRPAAFEGPAQEILVDLGTTCAAVAPRLQATAAALQNTIEAADDFTLAAYQESYTAAVEAARSARQPLLEFIARLRLGIVSEQFPLLFWRVHDRLQALAETLRWGVLRS